MVDIIFPFTTISILNVILIRAIRQRNKDLACLKEDNNSSTTKGKLLRSKDLMKCDNSCEEERSYNEACKLRRTASGWQMSFAISSDRSFNIRKESD